MVQEIRSLQKLAIFFRVSRWGRRGGGLYAVLYGTNQRRLASVCVCVWGGGGGGGAPQPRQLYSAE